MGPTFFQMLLVVFMLFYAGHFCHVDNSFMLYYCLRTPVRVHQIAGGKRAENRTNLKRRCFQCFRASVCLSVCLLIYSLHSGAWSCRLPGQTSDIPRYVQLAGIHDALSVCPETAVHHTGTTDLPLRGLSTLPRDPSAYLHHGRQNTLSAGN